MHIVVCLKHSVEDRLNRLSDVTNNSLASNLDPPSILLHQPQSQPQYTGPGLRQDDGWERDAELLRERRTVVASKDEFGILSFLLYAASRIRRANNKILWRF
ncbi:uncharacterized protein ARMOST_11449 [Armillaria ostoyae]|uniref:Uncharacterized protein n=1 Tax=Armillaria ostoyae TaxID=47428 RepID=A0A284RH81_ARMOS|nr:uncharacterized protein ARMOST_11449 [Armillaria ostoyae]